MKEYYDLYMSIGIACRPAMHLGINDLRCEAFPLDWQMAYSLDTVIHLFKSSFQDFFSDIEEDTKQEGVEKNRRIIDIKNNIISIHHFPQSQELEETQREFRKKMIKRFTNLDRKLRESKRIVLVANRTESLEQLKDFLKQFSQLYPHLEIKLINVRTVETKNSDKYERKCYHVAENLFIEEYLFNDVYNSETGEMYSARGNISAWGNILKSYYLSCSVDGVKQLKKYKSIIIYGAGKNCICVITKILKHELPITGIAVSDINNNPSNVMGYDVNLIEKYDRTSLVVISLANQKESIKIKDELEKKGYCNLAMLGNYHRLIFLNKKEE